MARYIVRRLLWSVAAAGHRQRGRLHPLLRLPLGRPGAAARRPPGQRRTRSQAIRESLGLDKSVPEQFWIYIKGVFTPLDLPGTDAHGPLYFGHSYQSNADVKDVILSDLPATVMLVFGAVIVWLAIAIPVGIISAVKQPLAARPHDDDHHPRLHLGAGLLARPRRPLPVRPGRRRVPDLPRDRQLRRGRRLHRQGRLDAAAVGRAGGGDRGDLRPLPALADDRRDGRGLHPHRAREGPARATGDHAPRAAQRDHADRHPARPRRRGAARRQRDPHRDRLQHPRASAPRPSTRSSAPTCR